MYADVVFQSLLDHRDTAGGHDYVRGSTRPFGQHDKILVL